MAKKEKPPLESVPLKHSPFAGLRAPTPAAAPDVPTAIPPTPLPNTPGAYPPSAAATIGEPAPPPAAAAAAKKSRGRLLQRRETKHRAGKAVIIVSGFEELRDFDEDALAALAKELKQSLGCGGTLETRAGKRELVLQGDRAAQVAALLRARGFRVDGVTS
jgi:translation initiation factor 1 (eIF-1/SUI1)